MVTLAEPEILHRLRLFDRAVEETERHYPDLQSFGPHSASAPYREKRRVKVLLAKEAGGPPGPDPIREEYSRILRRLDAFRKAKGKEYASLLHQDLRNYVHVYHATICHAEISQFGQKTACDLCQKDLIQELCQELRGEFDLGDLEVLIAALDTIGPEKTAGSLRPPCLGEASDTCHNTGLDHGECWYKTVFARNVCLEE